MTPAVMNVKAPIMKAGGGNVPHDHKSIRRLWRLQFDEYCFEWYMGRGERKPEIGQCWTSIVRGKSATIVWRWFSIQ